MFGLDLTKFGNSALDVVLDQGENLIDKEIDSKYGADDIGQPLTSPVVQPSASVTAETAKAVAETNASNTDKYLKYAVIGGSTLAVVSLLVVLLGARR